MRTRGEGGYDWRAWALLAICVATGGKLVLPPQVEFRNDLVVPVEVRNEGDRGASIVLRPGGRWSGFVPGIPRATWRALTPGGESPLRVGVLRAGDFHEPAVPLLLQRLVYFRFTRRINSRVGEARYFAPLITNSSGSRLSVSIIDATGREWPCNCVVAPGVSRAFIGYFGPLPARVSLVPLGRAGLQATRIQVHEGVISSGDVVELRASASIAD
jgi:hypothetical protein